MHAIAHGVGQRHGRIAQVIGAREAHGEWIGVMVVSERGAARIREVFDAARAREKAGERLGLGAAESADRAKLTDLVEALVDADVEVACVPIYKGWIEVDTFEDYRRAWSLVD